MRSVSYLGSPRYRVTRQHGLIRVEDQYRAVSSPLGLIHGRRPVQGGELPTRDLVGNSNYPKLCLELDPTKPAWKKKEQGRPVAATEHPSRSTSRWSDRTNLQNNG